MKSPQAAITRTTTSIGIGILIYFVVGFGGCLVRIVGNGSDWIGNNSPGSVFASYSQEAVIAFFIVIAIGIFSAIRPQLPTNANKHISLGFKAGLIAFPIAAIIIFGFVGFSSETKNESKTGRFYTVVAYNGISLKGNHYSKGSMIEVLEETENAICLKLPSGRDCYPTPLVLQKTGKKNVDSILTHGNVDTKTVQNKQVVTSGFSAFLGNLLISFLITFIAAISTVFISSYVSSVSSDQQPVLNLGGSNSQSNFSSTPNTPPISPPSSTKNYSTSQKPDESQIELKKLSQRANAKLDSLKNEIQSLAKQLQISFPLDYIHNEIQKTISSFGKKLLADATPLNNTVANLKQKATEDKNNLEKAHNLYQRAVGLYNEVLQKQPHLAEDLEYYKDLLNNQQIKSLLSERKWNDYQDALNLIIKELESNKPETDEEKAYRILGIPPTATDEQIKKIVKNLRNAYHPDLAGEEDKEFYDDKLKWINWANDVLKNRKR